MSYFVARKLSDTVLAYDLPPQLQTLVGNTVDWFPDVLGEDGQWAPAKEPIVVLITGVRWARNADNKVQHGWVQFLMDRMDGTQRWTDPLQVSFE